MIYERHYLQYNELVFDQYDMVEAESSSVSFKQFDSEYGFTHGSYSPQKQRGGLIKASSLSLTLKFEVNKLPCSQRPYYMDFVKTQLTTQGRLWAVENNTLIWAFAEIVNFDMQYTGKRDYFEVDVNFFLREGFWHKADKQKTFLLPYDVCDFMDCYPYHDINPCSDGNCCNCNEPPQDPICECCDCLSKEMALCYHTKEMQNLYAICGSGYRFVYDCEAADRFFDDFYGAEHPGQKFCSGCEGGYISGLLYSDTDIPTDGIKITLHGKFKNPRININDNANIISGTYDGVLEIFPDGSVYYNSEGCEGCTDPLAVSKWVIPEGNTYGWTVNPGNNKFMVDINECCISCAYVEVDARTI